MKNDIMKKILLITFFLLVAANLCFSITLLTEQEALDQLLPQADEVTTQKITASKEQLDMIKKELGGGLAHETESQSVKELNKQKEFTFYFGKKDNNVVSVAVILDEPGRWGLMKFIIYLDPKGEIKDAAVMKYSETRGRPVASRSFLDQFLGKTFNDRMRLGDDIQGISGATISSHAACFAMKKATVLYEILVLTPKLKR